MFGPGLPGLPGLRGLRGLRDLHGFGTTGRGVNMDARLYAQVTASRLEGCDRVGAGHGVGGATPLGTQLDRRGHAPGSVSSIGRPIPSTSIARSARFPRPLLFGTIHECYSRAIRVLFGIAPGANSGVIQIPFRCYSRSESGVGNSGNRTRIDIPYWGIGSWHGMPIPTAVKCAAINDCITIA